jgi:hypothetical protein
VLFSVGVLGGGTDRYLSFEYLYTVSLFEERADVLSFQVGCCEREHVIEPVCPEVGFDITVEAAIDPVEATYPHKTVPAFPEALVPAARMPDFRDFENACPDVGDQRSVRAFEIES